MKNIRQHRTIHGTHLACIIFRHIAQKSSEIHKVFPRIFGQSDENSDCAICAPELCGVAITKILAVLLCLAMLFTLSACGGDDKDTECPSTSVTDTEKNTDKETETTSGDKGTEIAGGDIVLPEDGKIEFGKDNGKSNKDNTDKDPGNTSSETTKPADTAKPTESETAKPTDDSSSTGGNPGDDNGWGDVHWN